MSTQPPNPHTPSGTSSPGNTDAAVANLNAKVDYLMQQLQHTLAINAQLSASSSSLNAASSLPKLRPPSQFKGEMGGTVDEWLGEMQQQFEYYAPQFDTHSARIRFAIANFTGPALQWWTHEPEETKKQTTTWEAFVALLHGRFRPVQAAMVARQRLDKLRQRTGQPVNQYANQFQSVLTPIEDMSHADQVHHFVNGLLPIIAGKVWERNPTKLKDAIDFAVSVEGMMNYGRSTLNPPSYAGYFRSQIASSSSATSSTSVPMDLNNIGEEEYIVDPAPAGTATDPLSTLLVKLESMETQLNALHQGRSLPPRKNDRIPNLKPGEIDQLRAEGRCFACKGKGHMKRDCPSRQAKGPKA